MIPGSVRLAYDQVDRFVQGHYGLKASKDRKEIIQNLLFVRLMGFAAIYTDLGNPLCYNRRPSYASKLLQRVIVESRVQTLTENFDLQALTPAVVVFDPTTTQRMESVREQWEAGNPGLLLEAVEHYTEGQETEFFTIVGNHSTQAHVNCSTKDPSIKLRRATFVFFSGQLTDDDFRFISRTENMSVQRAASTTTYKDHTEPLNIIPFICEYWKQFGRPPRPQSSRKKNRTKAEPDYADFQTLLHAVLEPQVGESTEKDEKELQKKMQAIKTKYQALKQKAVKDVKEAQARKQKLKEFEASERKALSEAQRDLGVIRYFHADLNIAMLPDDAYVLLMNVMKQLDNGKMCGIKEGIKAEQVHVRRHHYKGISCFSIGFYLDTFEALLDPRTQDDLVATVARVSNPRESVPN
ncbi:unnamed protein product, partial [Ostreobium quekettii]